MLLRTKINLEIFVAITVVITVVNTAPAAKQTCANPASFPYVFLVGILYAFSRVFVHKLIVAFIT